MKGEHQMNKVVSIEPLPPWELVKREMDEREWTQDDLAEVMSRSRQHINRLLQGKTSITPETAQELSAAFGTSAELWMNLQTSYELSLADKVDEDIKRRSEIYDQFPVRALVSRNWIQKQKSAVDLESSICDLLGIKSLNETPALSVAARKGTPYTGHNGAQWAWYCYARKLAKHVTASKFTQSKFESGLGDLLSLAAYPEDLRRVPKALADMGVRFVILKHLPKSRIDGVALWLNPSSPVVAMSLRYDRIDNFWFTLFHELIHIKYKDASPVDVDLSGKEQPEIEKRANSEAAEHLIPKYKLNSFISRNKPLYYTKRVVQFAQAGRIHPAIAVGQLKFRGELPPTHLNSLQVKVREHILGYAMTDGWGDSPLINEDGA